MQDVEFFLKGLLIGIIVSAPMGPIGVLCVQKTVNKGQVMGFLSGLGAATADTFYAFIAAFGVTFITNFLADNQKWFQIVGIGVLLFLGTKMLMNNPIKQYRYHKTSSKKRSAVKDYISVFLLTLSNPLTILFFGAAFTMLGFLNQSNYNDSKISLIVGVFSGAAMWWFVLTYVVNIFRRKFKLRNIFILNRISGILIILLSLTAVIKFFFLS